MPVNANVHSDVPMNTGRFSDRVALISGAARGQGRAHALRFAEEGAAIVAFDICRQIDSVPYPLATVDDLEETVQQVTSLGGRIIARQADVRDSAALGDLVAEGMSAFGRLDVVIANAGIGGFVDNTWSLTDDVWDDMIAVNLTGAWKTVRAAVPAMIEGGRGGSIVLTSSAAGLKGTPGNAHYTAAKHGLVGLMRSLAHEVAPHSIRVNTVHPSGVETPMIINDHTAEFMTRHPEMIESTVSMLPVALLGTDDVTNAVAWLCSDEARYITATCFPVDAGLTQR